MSDEFQPTVFTQIRKASEQEDNDAMEGFCRDYAPPLTTYVRRRFPALREIAEDLVQDFFVWLAKENWDVLRKTDPNLKFRRFICTLLFRHAIVPHLRRQRAQCRGAGTPELHFDDEWDEMQSGSEIDLEETIDRPWALGLIRLSFDRLRARSMADGKLKDFEAFEPMLNPFGSEKTSHSEIAALLGWETQSARNYLVKLRKAFNDELRNLVRQSLWVESGASDPEIDEEIRYMIQILEKNGES